MNEEKKTFHGAVVRVDELPYENRRKVALSAAEYFCEHEGEFEELLGGLIQKRPELCKFELEKVRPVADCADKLSPAQKNNVLFACLLFYVLSKGAYPHEYWTGALQSPEDTAVYRLKKLGTAFAECCENPCAAEKAVKSELLNMKRRDIAPLLSGRVEVGQVKLFEMLWDVIVRKIGNNSPRLWKNKLGEFIGKDFAVRRDCEFKEGRGNIEIYAVSYEGKLDKPMHDECEDCSFVTFYGDDNTWLAACSDGVGSCANSSEGSLLATEYLSEVISNYLNAHGISGGAPSERDWAEFIYRLRFRLAEDFYAMWEAAVMRTENFSEERGGVKSFSATLQFAFGCERFIACGRLGDGTFYVRTESGGGFILNDGVSGVTRGEVLTVPNLKESPSAMQISIFPAGEISDIIISSDGVSGALGEDIPSLERFVKRAEELPFEERCAYLSRTAKLCSEYNETHHGSGDDCTLAHIHLKDKRL